MHAPHMRNMTRIRQSSNINYFETEGHHCDVGGGGGTGSLRGAEEERAGSGIPKVAGTRRNRKNLQSTTRYGKRDV